jgi:Phospholipid-translocating ATPase N-terminal
MNTNTNLDNSVQSLNAPLKDNQAQESNVRFTDLVYHNAHPGQKGNGRHNIPWQEMLDRKIRAKQQDLELTDNSICTSKYTPVTFLPKNLLEQFSKLPNIYFFVTNPALLLLLSSWVSFRWSRLSPHQAASLFSGGLSL